ncbi:helix-turn-helix transcriptional regulator [Pseudonocardia sp. S2-4]|uniref:Helix-turn-helix transcriptional regulator n=1 Tax=Pseudonocardia humida TaxID=2800819 RepID=A0ABT1A351_9PSEU|nr:helix-turn-helix transcriptional regulator [Pseudonocardia humida]
MRRRHDGARRATRQARRRARPSQDEVAHRAGTSRPTLSAYEHGHRSPTLSTAARILAASGHELAAVPIVRFSEVSTRRGRTIAVPSHLPRLPPAQALATVQLPLRLHWSTTPRSVELRGRTQRARVYEIVLREGGPTDILTYVDGVLPTELWPDLVLPQEVRAAWALR